MSRPIDSKREEFRKYLERSGVMESLTKALISLYDETEKPSDALQYVRDHLGSGGGESDDVIALKEENATLKERLAQYEDKPHTASQSQQSLRSGSHAKSSVQEE